MKRKFENVEIISSLRSIMERNTRAYKEDFEYDVEKLLNCSAMGEKWFMWMSREHGTYCFCGGNVTLLEQESSHTVIGCDSCDMRIQLENH